MKSFFKIFFASIAALFFFCTFIIVLGVCTANSAVETISPKAVLTIDLSKTYPEVGQENPLLILQSDKQYDVPSLFEVVQLLDHAATNPNVKALYITGGWNQNGFGNSDEIRKAILKFKKISQKPVYAYATEMSQQSYYVMSAADSIFVNPQGNIEWTGLSTQLLFFKGFLEKLDIKAQIIYAGKFKSATEPFRETKMSEPNKIQYKTLLEDIFQYMVNEIAITRNIDPILLRNYADNDTAAVLNNALQLGLIDGLRYDDEVDQLFKDLVSISPQRKVAYESIGKYAKVYANEIQSSSADRIAVIAAEGSIIMGKATYGSIADEEYISLIRKARLSSSIKAIVLRINSGGGSSLASDAIWREVALAREEKPVVVSMGDYAASGGYYIATPANTIVADPTTLTGSIGVFALIPSFEKTLNNQLGITTDGVATSEKAKQPNVFEDLNPYQVKIVKDRIDTTYEVFKRRVAEGRYLDLQFVDSIAQGRVWSGIKAKELGLVDTLGTLQTAIRIAADLAHLSNYGIINYPDKKNALNFDLGLGLSIKQSKEEILEESLGKEGLQLYQTFKTLQSNYKTPMLMPYEAFILQ